MRLNIETDPNATVNRINHNFVSLRSSQLNQAERSLSIINRAAFIGFCACLFYDEEKKTFLCSTLSGGSRLGPFDGRQHAQ